MWQAFTPFSKKICILCIPTLEKDNKTISSKSTIKRNRIKSMQHVSEHPSTDADVLRDLLAIKYGAERANSNFSRFPFGYLPETIFSHPALIYKQNTIQAVTKDFSD